jgi:hypothetical protein
MNKKCPSKWKIWDLNPIFDWLKIIFIYYKSNTDQLINRMAFELSIILQGRYYSLIFKHLETEV